MTKKRFMILYLAALTSLYADLSVKDIEQMVQKIHLKREGISLKMLDQTKEPFVKQRKIEDTKEKAEPRKTVNAVKLVLHAIMENRAFINGGWKKIGDVIQGYELKYVGKRGVVLQNENRIKKLFLGKPKKEKFIMIEERI